MIFEKIRERLQKLCEQTYYNSVNGNRDEGIRNNAYHNAIDIINQVEAEYNNGWIPCSKRLPIGEEYRKIIDGSYFYKHMLTTTNEDDIPICVGWYDQENEVWCDLEGFAFYPIAWKPLPERYTPKGE